MDKQIISDKFNQLVDELSVNSPRENVIESIHKVLSMSPEQIGELIKASKGADNKNTIELIYNQQNHYK